jgi:transcriptional regulator with GAF, ATPase, and Fis domain
MQQLVLTADQVALIDESAAPAAAPTLDDDDALMAMPLVDAKRLVAAEFERRYLVRLMERAGGSVSEGARLSGLDRTNFRRLLQRHGLR